jgi:hypothetical protein
VVATVPVALQIRGIKHSYFVEHFAQLPDRSQYRIMSIASGGIHARFSKLSVNDRPYESSAESTSYDVAVRD